MSLARDAYTAAHHMAFTMHRLDNDVNQNNLCMALDRAGALVKQGKPVRQRPFGDSWQQDLFVCFLCQLVQKKGMMCL